ncbi:methionine synthase II (cobalamin-independent) [Pseudanabaena sp. FACHB-2040]|uniref:methionine synthase II (cobalamin-independent) n=1 Tax=Pseudanabaena sp. FACHB-2040 TaxID=2692859 RepID=UPI0016866F95|nr:methionine synthase II (cobalamin-independent) [Pseudanabaena sp. FACHB-2040]MBD2261321.1 methionine synthase II (cobalamin-independent) [Pseudanabaena sp. FACHB-2040]
MAIQTMSLGYARMDKRRELKKALETFWSGVSGADALLTTLYDLETKRWQAQVKQMRTGIANLPTEQIGANPDCGSKTRRWEEEVPTLKNRVAAAQTLREEIYDAAH